MAILWRTLKATLLLMVFLLVALALTLLSARFADGPWEVIAGGEFRSGSPAESEPDWRFVKDYNTVEFQLLEPASSRTTWIMVTQDRVFIPSGYMNTPFGKLWKHWPAQAQEDGRAILRVDDTLYARQLHRVPSDDPAMAGVLSEISRKYFDGAPVPLEEVTSNNLWIFELLPRAS